MHSSYQKTFRGVPVKKDTLYNYRESKRLQQADVANLEKVARGQMEEVAKLQMEQERLTKSLQGKD